MTATFLSNLPGILRPRCCEPKAPEYHYRRNARNAPVNAAAAAPEILAAPEIAPAPDELASRQESP
jgi:hypothetical protein